ncbi:hypothetical protein [Burkholderia anthina]|uniref:hypothetical protein n=1 Tax=Burkholderia anthina TaxID=179879 RepID=UPI001FC7BE67|nr:hypothetical protein [Burkholderia anthina]
MHTLRNAHVEQRDAARFGWSTGATGCSGMNGRNGMVGETSALLCMIGSNSWGQRRIAVGRDRAGCRAGGPGGCRLPDGRAAPGGPGNRYAGLDGDAAWAREARWIVFLDVQYGRCAASGKSAGIEDAVGDVEVL